MADQSISIAPMAVGHVDNVKGMVIARHEGEERVLHVGDLVYSNETVQAKAGGSASLKLQGKTVPITDNSGSLPLVELSKSSSITDDSESMNTVELSKPMVSEAAVVASLSDTTSIQAEPVNTTGHFTTVLDQSFLDAIVDEDEQDTDVSNSEMHSSFGLNNSAIEAGMAGFDHNTEASDARADEAVVNFSRPVETAAATEAAIEDPTTDEGSSQSGDGDHSDPTDEDNCHGKDDNKDPTDEDNGHGKDDNKDPTDEDNGHGKDDNKDPTDEDNGHGKDDNKDPSDDKDNGHGKDENDDTTDDANSSDDAIRGGEGNDKLHGDEGDNSLYGEAGKDTLRGGSGDDDLFGGEGNDKLHGNSGDDFISGGLGNDFLRGGSGNDTLLGGLGDDNLRGGKGDDTFEGGAGDDNLRGGKGDDIFKGGAGDDTMSGGKGNDQYVYEQGQSLESHDVITDFSIGDSVDLGGLLESLGKTDADVVITNNAVGDAQVQIADGSGSGAGAFAGGFLITFDGLSDMDLANTDGVITHK